MVCSGVTICRELDCRTCVRILASISIPLEMSVMKNKNKTMEGVLIGR